MSSSRYENFFDTVFNEEKNNFQKGFAVEDFQERGGDWRADRAASEAGATRGAWGNVIGL